MERMDALKFGERAYAKGIGRDSTKDEEFKQTLSDDLELRGKEIELLTESWKKGWDNGKILDELGF